MITIEIEQEVDGGLIAQVLQAPHVRVEGEGPYSLTVFGVECTEQDLQTAVQETAE